MTRDETAALLRARSAMTSTPYGPDAVDAWHAALAPWSFDQARPALIRAARDQKRVTVADVVAQLPARHDAPLERPAQCELCDGNGWVDMPRERAHRTLTCVGTSRPELGCRCTNTVDPCRCSRGQRIAARLRSAA